MNVFIYYATVGGGHIPILPQEIREIIWKFTLLSYNVKCSLCNHELNTKLLRYYKIWDDVVRCASCVGYPHNII